MSKKLEGWQPIETAPRDGTEVELLFTIEAPGIVAAMWPVVRVASWSSALAAWSIPYWSDCPPTHWRPSVPLTGGHAWLTPAASAALQAWLARPEGERRRFVVGARQQAARLRDIGRDDDADTADAALALLETLGGGK